MHLIIMNLIKDNFKLEMNFTHRKYTKSIFEINKVLHLIKNEISLFHNNSALLNRFFGGYTEYLDHLTKSDEPIDNTILADKKELDDGKIFSYFYF